MKKTKLRLFLLAAILTATALASAPRAAVAECFFYCWFGQPGEVCCLFETCEIVCWP